MKLEFTEKEIEQIGLRMASDIYLQMQAESKSDKPWPSLISFIPMFVANEISNRYDKRLTQSTELAILRIAKAELEYALRQAHAPIKKVG